MKKRYSALAWICTLLLVPAIVSCGSSAVSETAGTAAETAAAEETTLSEEEVQENELAEAVSHIPEKDYGGKSVTVMYRDPDLNGLWGAVDVVAEEENGDVINDAVYKRNLILNENLNVVIEGTPVDKPYTEAKTLILAGDTSFDVVTDGLTYLAQIATSGYLYDLKAMPGLALENEWWDQQMNTELTIAGKLFFMTGDISIMDNYGTWCIMFNKTIVQDYDLDDLYQTVRDGKWTMDVMYDMAKTVTRDLNGDGKITDEDQWGYFSETYNQYGLWAAGNNRIIEKDENDYPVLAELTNHASDVMDKVSAIQRDTGVTLSGERVADGTGCTYTNVSFGEGRALFIYGGMWLITFFRDYDVNFGVLPAPKYDEAQESYCNTYSYSNCTAYSVPVNVEDPEMVGTTLEAMAELSKYTLTPAYYEKALKGKYVRDEESAEMLDIILNGRIYDLGMIFDWGGMFSAITGLATTTKDYATVYASKEKATNKAIEKFVTALSDME